MNNLYNNVSASTRLFTNLICVLLFFSFALNTNAQVKEGEQLFNAVASKDLDKVTMLINKKEADVNYVRRINSAFYIPVLMQAVMNNSTEIASFLINKGADVNAQDGFKMTSLMWAANHGNITLVKLLLKKGADKNIADANGLTALKAAQDKNHKEIVNLLKTN